MENVTRKKVFGRSVIIRKRVSKRKPIGYSSGSCFHKLDAGYWSLYVSLRKPQRKVGFGTITVSDLVFNGGHLYGVHY